LNGEAFGDLDEVLKIDNILRNKLNYPLKGDAIAQPWTEENDFQTSDVLVLEYELWSEIEIDSCKIALENEEITQVFLNGEKAQSNIDSYFVDKSIGVKSLPTIKKGKNELRLQLSYNKKSNLEWCYILGDFGVEVYGNKGVIVNKPRKIGFSDLVLQKHPFYGGNISYEVDINVDEGEYELQISKFRAPLITIKLDGVEVGDIMFSPYKINLGRLSGKHKLSIVVFGNRFNTFGALHSCDDNLTWHGPNAWRTRECEYSYEYQLKKSGILAAPLLIKKC
jgi:hypothetical protein